MMNLAENSENLRDAADALDLAALAVAIRKRTGLIGGADGTEQELRESIAAGEAARQALEALKTCFALESGRLGQIRSGFAMAGAPPKLDYRG